jgi:hypothetical protein
MSGRLARASAPASRLIMVPAVALLLVLAALSSGCSKEQESLVGTWTSAEQGETLDFRSEGTLFFTRADGKVDTLRWQSDDSSLAIGVEGGGTKTFSYSAGDGVLTLNYPDELPAKYTRVQPQGD